MNKYAGWTKEQMIEESKRLKEELKGYDILIKFYKDFMKSMAGFIIIPFMILFILIFPILLIFCDGFLESLIFITSISFLGYIITKFYQMEYTMEQFHQDVFNEALNIKTYASWEEKQKLDFDSFSPNSPRKCIYGQLTGSCISPRAIELIKKCCPIYFENKPGKLCRKSVDITNVDDVFSRVGESLEIDARANGYIERLSAIETYILTPNAKNQELIEFIKGKRTDFKP